jgi:hypothetical protein
MNPVPLARGRKRTQLNIAVDRLHLDPENPRLSDRWKIKNELELLKVLYEQYNLLEIAESMAKNGYFDEEPLVATPQDIPKDLRYFDDYDTNAKSRFEDFINQQDVHFTVVEGNRRLATVKLLLSTDLKIKLKVSSSFPVITTPVEEDLCILPVIVYPNRDEVIPYLGVRHILGIEKWDPYAKAFYIAELIRNGKQLEQVREQIGDKRDAVLRSYVSYQLLQQAKDEFDFDIKNAKTSFSLLMLAIGQNKIRAYIGLPKRLTEVNLDEPVPTARVDNLRDILTWIFGYKGTAPIINDSRQITSLLANVVDSEAAVNSLKNQGYSLKEAYDLTDGEERMVIKYLGEASRKIEKVIGIAHRHKTEEIVQIAEIVSDNANKLLADLKSE